MKKRAASLALVLSMILSFTCQAGAVDANSGDDGQQVSTYAALEASAQSGGLTKLDAVKYILLDCGMKTTQFPSGDSDYIAMAKSVGIADDKFDGSAACSLEELYTMANSTAAVNLRNAVKNGTPLFVDGVAQPIFPYTSGVPTKDGYSNDKSDIIRYSVYVETNYDTDGDGKLDLVKALVQLPRAAAEGKYKAAAIYDARPYITGCTDYGRSRGFNYKNADTDYDLDTLYGSAAPRDAQGEMSTMDAAKNASADEWYYLSPYESYPNYPFYDYEDLDWYDYFLVRGYAAIEVGGLGTRGSEGLETCGTDVETDAFKCVIEWLTGNRVAYTDKESNIEIKADWSNGNVAMTGRSYGGTTDFAVASTGVKGLKTIVPVAGIASWYEYTNSQGISTSDNPAYSDNLGLYCAGRYIDEDDWNSIKDTYQAYLNRIYNDQVALNGDYGTHWATRDYTAGNTGKKTDNGLTYDNFSCPALIVHGLNDTNVRTKQFQLMYDAFKNANQNVKLLLHQGAHITPDYDSYKTSLLIVQIMAEPVVQPLSVRSGQRRRGDGSRHRAEQCGRQLDDAERLGRQYGYPAPVLRRRGRNHGNQPVSLGCDLSQLDEQVPLQYRILRGACGLYDGCRHRYGHHRHACGSCQGCTDAASGAADGCGIRCNRPCSSAARHRPRGDHESRQSDRRRRGRWDRRDESGRGQPQCADDERHAG